MTWSFAAGRLAALVLCLGAISSAQAANWLMLQSIEPPDQKPGAKVWGFIQVNYAQDLSDPVVTADGTEVYVPSKLVGADQSAFNVQRARIGVRGNNLTASDKVNYFLLVEFGNNALTEGQGKPRVTDASITLNHIPGARIRAGLFKNPSVEEGTHAVFMYPWIEFTAVTNQLMLERYSTASATAEGQAKPGAAPLPADLNFFDTPVSAFRDTGVQVFDSFIVGQWEHSYAVKVGNGNGLRGNDVDGAMDYIGYWSSARIFAGKGPFRQDLKLFAWYQEGRRSFFVADGSVTEFDRTRSGLGLSYYRRGLRVTTEYLQGKGMIFQGTNNPDQIGNDNEAAGWYLESGWEIPKTPWEIDLRYDTYTRNKDLADETVFDTWTAGLQYHFNQRTRVAVQYADRDFTSASPAQDTQLEGVGGRVLVQLTTQY